MPNPDDLRKLIELSERRLQYLKKQQAIMGIRTPPEISIEIEDLEKKIAKLKAEMKQMQLEEESLKEMLPSSSDDKTSPPQPSWNIKGRVFEPTLPYTALCNRLKRFDPFAAVQTEDELTFLFGDTVGFWPDHPLFAQVSHKPEAVEIILAQPGAGKTAFAHGLMQVGEAVNNQPFDILPVYVPGSGADDAGIGRAIIKAMREFSRKNLLRDPGPGFALDGEKIQEALTALGFSRAWLIIDINDHLLDHLQTCLHKLETWRNWGLTTKLFAPESANIDTTGRFRPQTLTWNNHQLRMMADWRFESITRKAGVRIAGLSELFEGGEYTYFFTAARGNPGRLMQVWAALIEDHQKFTPTTDKFTGDNFERAVKGLQW